MLVDAGKENYSYTDHVCKLNVILLRRRKMEEMVSICPNRFDGDCIF